MSTLHIVDPFTSSISAARSFADVIRKIAMAGGNRLPDAPIAPTSENSSDNNGLRKINYGIMSQCLLPLLAGNCRTYFLLSLSSSLSCVEDTSNILRCCSPCLHISSACARHRNIRVDMLDLQDSNGVRPFSRFLNTDYNHESTPESKTVHKKIAKKHSRSRQRQNFSQKHARCAAARKSVEASDVENNALDLLGTPGGSVNDDENDTNETVNSTHDLQAASLMPRQPSIVPRRSAVASRAAKAERQRIISATGVCLPSSQRRPSLSVTPSKRTQQKRKTSEIRRPKSARLKESRVKSRKSETKTPSAQTKSASLRQENLRVGVQQPGNNSSDFGPRRKLPRNSSQQLTVEDIGALRSSSLSPTLEKDTQKVFGVALRSEIILEQASMLNLHNKQTDSLENLDSDISAENWQERMDKLLARNKALGLTVVESNSQVQNAVGNDDQSNNIGEHTTDTFAAMNISNAKSQSGVTVDKRGAHVSPEKLVKAAETKLRTEINSVLDNVIGLDPDGATFLSLESENDKKTQDSEKVVQQQVDKPEEKAQKLNEQNESEITISGAEKQSIVSKELKVPAKQHHSGIDVQPVPDESSDATMLLKLLHEEQRMHKKQQQKVELLEREIQEQRTIFEIEIDSMRLERIQMLSRLRKMERESNYPDLFAQYEDKIGKLASELKDARSALLAHKAKQYAEGHEANLTELQTIDQKQSRFQQQSKALAASRLVEHELREKVKQLEETASTAERKQHQFHLHKKHLIIARSKLVPLEQKDRTSGARAGKPASASGRSYDSCSSCRRRECEVVCEVANHAHVSFLGMIRNFDFDHISSCIYP